MFKKIAAILIALLLCLAVTGCSGEDAPDGMHNVTADGQPFVLYVPDSWSDNSSSGISGAYVNAADGAMTVSARFYARESAVTLESFVNECLNAYSIQAEEYALASNNAVVLGGADAKEIVYTAKSGKVDYTFCQRIVKHTSAEGFVVVAFSCPTSLYEDNAAQLKSVFDAFLLCEMPAKPNDSLTDKKTPVGMKIASADQLQYRLYVPTSWVCNSESGVSEAYVDKAGKPNVTVTVFSPDEDITVESYWEKCEAEYTEKLSGYTFTGSAKRTVGEKEAVSYTYTAVYDGVTLKLMQTVVKYQGMLYSITYTATAEDFDSYIADVNSMLDAFIFR